MENLVAACWSCNRGKGPLPPDGWDAEDVSEREFYEWSEAMDKIEFPDDLLEFLYCAPERPPLMIDFDFYAAAQELAKAEQVLAITDDTIWRKAELFTDGLY